MSLSAATSAIISPLPFSSASHPLRAVFFDIGDTLVTDTPSLEDRIWTASVQSGITFPRECVAPALRSVEDYVLEQYVAGLTLDDPATLVEATRRLLARLGAPDADPIAFIAESHSITFDRVLHPAAIELIESLRARGIKVGIVSDWDEQLPDLMAGWGLAERVDAVAVSSIVGCTKPDRRLFENALVQAGVEAANCIHVGDFYELDVAGAVSAGMQALLYDWRGRKPGADCLRAETFEQVVGCLKIMAS